MNTDSHLHEHNEHKPAETPLDAGSQALAEALRSSFAVVKFVMVALVIVFLGSGFFQVGPQQQAILLRFGKPVGEGKKALLGPGLHWSYPFPIDEHTNVSVLGIQEVKSTVGWFYMTPAEIAQEQATGALPPVFSPNAPLNPAVDSYVLTADGNIIHTRATLRYLIDDPIQFTFGFANAADVVQGALNNALVQSAAQFKVDDILTTDKVGFRDAVRQHVTELLDKENAGVSVQDCIVDSIPPRQLTDAFNQVITARQQTANRLNAARRYENEAANKSEADARSIVNLAELARVQLVTEIGKEATNFDNLLPQYNANPGLLVQQRFNETLADIMSNTNLDKKVIPVAPGGKPAELRILLDQQRPPKTTIQNP